MYRYSKSAVKINNEFSDFFELNRGVKQGDSLSPTLFNCFINDIHEIFDNTCMPLVLEKSRVSSVGFADDLIFFYLVLMKDPKML